MNHSLSRDICFWGGKLVKSVSALFVLYENVDKAIVIILMNSEAREHGIKVPKPANNVGHLFVPGASRIVVSGATIFVTDVESYEKF